MSGELVFALASCQYPAGMLDAAVAEASYRRLAERKAKPRFLLLVGDQIYADATAGLFDPGARFDRFERPYDVLRDMLTRLDIREMEIFTMLDDHEIEDNWEPLPGGRPDPLLAAGREGYLKQRRRLGPDLVEPTGDSREPLYYDFERQGFPFFVADTRTERRPRTAASVDRARIMSDTQFDRLIGWLDEQNRRDPERPKFIASPSILLPRRLRAARAHPAAALRSDAWDGYPQSLHGLLAHIARERIRNVVFLSGDEHLSCVARAELHAPGGAPAVSVLSVHSSGLYAPFPFANSTSADLAGEDRFTFSPGAGEPGYRCEVRTEFAPGDGFAVVRVARDAGGWRLDCEFDRADGTVRLSRKL